MSGILCEANRRRFLWAGALTALAAFLVFDFVSTLGTCPPSEQQQAEQGTEKRCGLTQSLTYTGAEIVLEWINRRHDVINAAATFIIALFTIALWRATDRLWDAGERQLVHLTETTRSQLRAYIHVQDVIMSLMNSQWHPNIQVIIKNFGQTPAYQVFNTYRCCPMVGLPEEADFSLDRTDINELADLGPTQQTFSSWAFPLNDWNAIKPKLISGQRRFYVFGRIDYRDAFGRPWYTEYRYLLLIDSTGIKNETSLVIGGRAGNKST
jgi:hypothetical protein